MIDATNLDDLTDLELEDMLKDPTTEGDDNNNELDSNSDDNDKNEESNLDDDDNNEDGATDDNNKGGAPKSIQKLLLQRAEARKKVSDQEKLIEDQNQIIKDLQANGNDSMTDYEKQEKIMDAKLEKRFLQEDKKREARDVETQKSNLINSFLEKTPEIGKYKDDFVTACNNFPDLNPRQVFAILKDEKGIGGNNDGNSDTYSLAGTGKSKSSVTKSYESMSDQELENEIRAMSSKGNL